MLQVTKLFDNRVRPRMIDLLKQRIEDCNGAHAKIKNYKSIADEQ